MGELVTTQVCEGCGSEMPSEARYCPDCGVQAAAYRASPDEHTEIARLRQALADLQEVVDNNADIQERLVAHLASSNIFSDIFWKRAWAIWGHAVVVGLIVGGSSYLLMGLLFAASS